MKWTVFTLINLFLLIYAGCSEPVETPTKGKVQIYTDESVLPLVMKERESFMSKYPEAEIDVVPINAADGVAKLLNGETEMFLSSRNFTNDEQTFINNHHLTVKSYDFCYGGIAVIASKESKLKEISLQDLKSLLLGKTHTLKIFMPGEKTGIYEFVKDEYLDEQNPDGAVLVPGDNEIKAAIKKDHQSIGLTGFNLIQDTSEIKVLPVGLLNYKSNKIVYYRPHPAYFVNGNYPLTREIYIFINEDHMGLASGFTAYLTSTEGQKVVLSQNLAPAAVPVKLVKH